MPKSFAFTTELDHHVRDVHAVLTDERYWLDRVADRASATAIVEEPHGPGSVRVTVTDRSEPSELPSIVRGMLRGPLIVERTDEWGPLVDDVAEGLLSGGATGLPVALEGRSRLRTSRTGGTYVDVQGAGRRPDPAPRRPDRVDGARDGPADRRARSDRDRGVAVALTCPDPSGSA
ncbi:DUF2505 domain-containing protein [Rhodococcus rhodochrous]|uniref:DUF2505 domain-containing protein n=1 Tax=Rhodococcus rhodochrous TaxID=1829 RepID=UPI000AE389CE